MEPFVEVPERVLAAGESMADDYIADFRQPAVVRHRIIDEIAAQLPDDVTGRAVLDVGCGDGDGTAPLIRLAASGLLTGIDPSPAMVSRARASHPAIRFEVGDFSRMPAADAGVGLVAAFNSWHHVSDRIAALAEARRVLEPGGLLAISGALREDLATQLVHQWFPEFHAYERAKHQSRDELLAVARDHGFGLVAASTREFEISFGSREQTIELIRRRPFFGLRLMPQHEFHDGFARFAERVTANESGLVVTRSRSTLILLRSAKGHS